MRAKKTTTDDVMRLTRGETVFMFTYEEWTCARVMWLATGQRLGPVVMLYNATSGSLDAAGVEGLRAILDDVVVHVLGRELNSNIAHGGAAGLELFELVKTTWRLPYRHVTDSTDTVRIGGKRIAELGAPGAPQVPRLGDIPAFRSAFDKLSDVVATEGSPFEFVAVGPLYLAQRR
jgi:hypothetical protein